jgi:hypothetical protein
MRKDEMLRLVLKMVTKYGLKMVAKYVLRHHTNDLVHNPIKKAAFLKSQLKAYYIDDSQD